jgi:alpha-glucuronidase
VQQCQDSHRAARRTRLSLRYVFACVLLLSSAALPTHAEDGYELWLRYRPVDSPWLERYREVARELIGPGSDAAGSELERAFKGLLAVEVRRAAAVDEDGAIVYGTPESSAAIASLKLDLHALGHDGFLLRQARVKGHSAIIIAGNADAGVLHGAFALLKMMQIRRPLEGLNLASRPRIELRMLDHWDNLDGTIERGYAGASIWDWQKLPGYLSQRYTDYARACASIGINATVLTNVNADSVTLTPAYLKKIAALAQLFRRYGLKVYVTPRFTAPIELGGLKSADPLDPDVKRWWHDKIEEIYRYIPDFGGFLVKANSEGQPGPQDYHRTHADGANMFADLLAPHSGMVIWRAFVYGSHEGDRVKQAYEEFAPLDGQFHDNVLVQVKNGPLDFQPREPVHPLFGAMPKTPLALEVQITKEYLGFATHLVYLGTLYQEVLHFDTQARGAGSTVANIIDGSLEGHVHSAMAGVSNVGADRNWTGSIFDQANWYAFGRLAWDPTLSARDIADEWLRMTFSNDPRFLTPVLAMMMGSREAAVDYMTPLGLTHLMAAGHHYGPGAWQELASRAQWNPPYYHRAAADGIGFDRTQSGSDAVAQYSKPIAGEFTDVASTPESYLLWFHHLPWDYRLKSGDSLWDEIVMHYTRGVVAVQGMRATWAEQRDFVDAERFDEVSAFLAIQEQEAQWWRDATLAYFQSISKRPFPRGYAPPAQSLKDYEAINVPYAPGNPGWTAAPFKHQ